MKRSNQQEQDQDFRNVKVRADLDSKLYKNYSGYKPLEQETAVVDTINLPRTDKEIQNFFNQYVTARKPCKILGVSPQNFPRDELKPDKVVNYLPSDEILTVETKKDGGFGSGAKRVKMTFGQFMSKLNQEGEHSLYLTTQYYEDDPNAVDSQTETDEEEKDQILSDGEDSVTFQDMHDDFDQLEGAQEEEDVEDYEEYEMRLRELYQPPMTNLVKTLPETPEFLKYLIPQQINIWIGAASTIYNDDSDNSWLSKFNPNEEKLGLGRNVPGGGSSSGLHHDHADNLYIPVSGRKRFTLFAPSDAAKMYTVGNIREIYASGVIDYVPDSKAPTWRQLRDDGAILAHVYNYLLENPDDHKLNDQEIAEFRKFIESDEMQAEKEPPSGLDPPSFSEIPPSVVHTDKIKNKKIRDQILKISSEKWPLFQSANRLTVELEPGEMLYLPTGWFHEVTSFGDSSKSNDVHVAVNYWFVPPTGHQIDAVYDHKDGYWPKDYELTKKALDWARTEDDDDDDEEE
ncbi:hypothetical protein ZYGR_0N01980 [Zygosaccharomyces rouxii]|uniref:ZYRO0D04884p n=2 Tax=Zygosaccharomyces rouxii TaxID=4956 RepID=C5DV93_ZYGRC|nr:uncharacterized protein ZYRO0D04884g [Zygosaccharomyces rouxii]KAH9200625.1 cupin-like domain-containing protein [Zygosaccharomyces rouxii]GAV48793.1 hypothetical protein ZYGR_0N01980 [Zygosaccharomyces rouxii]CAR27712.1 ZYRO0D04884p [Zygosaccharomyces rouxii]